MSSYQILTENDLGSFWTAVLYRGEYKRFWFIFIRGLFLFFTLVSLGAATAVLGINLDLVLNGPANIIEFIHRIANGDILKSSEKTLESLTPIDIQIETAPAISPGPYGLWLDVPIIVMLAVSSLVILFSLLACFGNIWGYSVAILVYCLFHLFITALMLVLIFLYFFLDYKSDLVSTYAKDELASYSMENIVRSTIHLPNTTGYSNTSLPTPVEKLPVYTGFHFIMEFIQTDLQCCGFRDKRDWPEVKSKQITQLRNELLNLNRDKSVERNGSKQTPVTWVSSPQSPEYLAAAPLLPQAKYKPKGKDEDCSGDPDVTQYNGDQFKVRLPRMISAPEYVVVPESNEDTEELSHNDIDIRNLKYLAEESAINGSIKEEEEEEEDEKGKMQEVSQCVTENLNYNAQDIVPPADDNQLAPVLNIEIPDNNLTLEKELRDAPLKTIYPKYEPNGKFTEEIFLFPPSCCSRNKNQLNSSYTRYFRCDSTVVFNNACYEQLSENRFTYSKIYGVISIGFIATGIYMVLHTALTFLVLFALLDSPAKRRVGRLQRRNPYSQQDGGLVVPVSPPV